MNEQTTQSNMPDVSNSATGDNKEQKEQERRAKIEWIKSTLKDAIGLGEEGELRVLLRSGKSSKGKSEYAEFYDILKKEEKKISGCILQFDTEVLITTVVGMLKAGKSTLISLLARNELATPVGYGIDTTLRPALIYMRKKNEEDKPVITVYTQKDPGEKKKKKERYEQDIHDLLNELRGIKVDNSNLQQDVYPLDNYHLEKLLCKTREDSDNLYEKEPLLVVVKLPYNEDSKILAGGDRCLLDLPGLDSHIADVCKEESTDQKHDDDEKSEGMETRKYSAVDFSKYQHLVSQSDVVLLMQSSTAPLNKPAYEDFIKICGERENCTTWHVLNTVVNKFWINPTILEDEIAKQRGNVLATFSEPDQPSSTCNFGMAYSAYFERTKLNKEAKLPNGNPVTSDSLLAESKYPAFEKKLNKTLIENGWVTRVIHCCEQWLTEMDHFEESVEKYEKNQEERLDNLRQKKCRYELIKQMIIDEENVRQTLYATSFSLTESKLDTFSKGIGAIIREEKKTFMNTNGTAFKGEILDTFIEQLEGKCRERIRSFLDELSIDDLMCVPPRPNNTDGSGEAKKRPARFCVQEDLKRSIKTLKTSVDSAVTRNSPQEQRRDNIDEYLSEIDKYIPQNQDIPGIDSSHVLKYKLEVEPSFLDKTFRGTKSTSKVGKFFGIERRFGFTEDENKDVLDHIEQIKCASIDFVKQKISERSKEVLEQILTENVGAILQKSKGMIETDEERVQAKISDLETHLKEEVDKVKQLIDNGKEAGGRVRTAS